VRRRIAENCERNLPLSAAMESLNESGETVICYDGHKANKRFMIKCVQSPIGDCDVPLAKIHCEEQCYNLGNPGHRIENRRVKGWCKTLREVGWHLSSGSFS
jgi:hypothetical protein